MKILDVGFDFSLYRGVVTLLLKSRMTGPEYL